MFIRKLEALSLFSLRRTGRMGLFLAKAFFFAVTPPLKFSQLLKQIQFIGFQSVLVIFLTGAFSGMVLGLQGFYTLNRFGSVALLGPMIALSLIKELGPVLSALVAIKKFDLELAVGLFIIAGIVCLGYLSIKLGKLEIVGEKGYGIYGVFSNIGGLKIGSSVEIAGVSVGRVKSITLNNYQADVVLNFPKGLRIQEMSSLPSRPGV